MYHLFLSHDLCFGRKSRSVNVKDHRLLRVVKSSHLSTLTRIVKKLFSRLRGVPLHDVVVSRKNPKTLTGCGCRFFWTLSDVSGNGVARPDPTLTLSGSVVRYIKHSSCNFQDRVLTYILDKTLHDPRWVVSVVQNRYGLCERDAQTIARKISTIHVSGFSPETP